MIQIPTFKIRCSQIGQIMGGALTKPTEKQLARIEELTNKPKVRTELQEKELQELILKRDSQPQIQAGAKTYCQEWVKEQIYSKTKEFSNKYTEKGIQCEKEAIDMVAEVMGYGFVAKNEKHYEDADLTGTPDLVVADAVEEIKNSWSIYTFPLLAETIPDTDYFFQVQGYMALTNKSKAAVNYCLIDAPVELIDAEARRACYKAGMAEVDMELYDEVAAKMTYAGIQLPLRFKRFEFIRDDNAIAAIRTQVELCRMYISTIYPVHLISKQPATA